MKYQQSPVRDEWRVDLVDAPQVEVKSWGHRRLRYRVTSVIVVHLLDGNDYLALYGVRVRRDGVSFGREVPVSGNYREVTSL